MKIEQQIHKIVIMFFIVVVIGVMAIPEEVFAQTSGRRSSSLRRKINKLDDDKVVSVPMPILFGLTPDNMISDFGDLRGGGTRRHEGQDILAPRGAPIATPTAQTGSACQSARTPCASSASSRWDEDYCSSSAHDSRSRHLGCQEARC